MGEQEYLQMFGKSRDELLEETKQEIRKASKNKDKAKVKELVALFRRAFVGDDVFWANEVGSNVFTAVIMALLGAILGITVLLSELGVYDFNNDTLIPMVNICVAEVIVGLICFFVTKGQKKWVKVVMMLIICLTVSTAVSILGYRAIISAMIPVILSTKYLSEKFTRFIAFVSGILLFTGTVYSAYVAVAPDLNNIVYAPGTAVVIENSLKDAVAGGEVITDLYVKNLIMHMFIPDFLQFLLVCYVCITIAKWGHSTIKEQENVAKEFARVDTELNLAKDIQSNVLPNIFPAFPERNEFDIHATMDPAKEVGGDFYDFFLVDDNHLAMVMADVSGKGVPAALFMMIGKALIKTQCQLGISPREVLEKVNDQLCENNESGLFITVWLGIMEISTGKVVATNAGHEYPCIRKATGEYEVLKDKHGLVLAAMEGAPYKDYEFTLEPGDSLYVYTDGVPEATNASNEMYGMDRMVESLNSALDESPEEVLKTVRKSIDAFVGKAPQFDDITMLGLTYLGPDAAGKEINKEE